MKFNLLSLLGELKNVTAVAQAVGVKVPDQVTQVADKVTNVLAVTTDFSKPSSFAGLIDEVELLLKAAENLVGDPSVKLHISQVLTLLDNIKAISTPSPSGFVAPTIKLQSE